MRAFLEKVVGPRRWSDFLQNVHGLRRCVRPKLEPEAYTLSRYVPEGGVAFDIGANYGQYTRVLAACVGGKGRVHAFEPARTTFRCLQRNVRLLRLRNVRTWNVALGERTGEADFYLPVKEPGRYGHATASLAPPQGRALVESVNVDTLDSFCAREGIGRLDFIRCDVEGAEGAVLRGGINTLARFRPVLLFEVHPSMMAAMGDEVEEFVSLVRRHRYEMFRLEGNALRPVKGTPELNVYCFPDERLEEFGLQLGR